MGDRRATILTGSPSLNSLAWNESKLLKDFIPAFRRYLGHIPSHSASGLPSTAASSAAWPNWREISLQNQSRTATKPPSRRFGPAPVRVRAGEPAYGNGWVDDISVLSTTFSLSPEESIARKKRKTNEDEAQKNFLEHSFAIHEDLKSSQIVGEPTNETDVDLDATTLATTSFLTSASSLTGASFGSTISVSEIDSHNKSRTNVQHIDIPARITNLKDLPKADHILRIAPQTITVNLLVGIIRIFPARTVRTKRGGQEMDIIELLVGDDTSTPFSITFWLQPDAPQPNQGLPEQQQREPLREALDGLRIQDVVLLRAVALHAFQGKVHGQSLSRRITRNETRVQLLGRGGERAVDGEEEEKVRRVVEWVRQFVAPAARPFKAQGERGNERRRMRVEELPPDTQ